MGKQVALRDSILHKVFGPHPGGEKRPSILPSKAFIVIGLPAEQPEYAVASIVQSFRREVYCDSHGGSIRFRQKQRAATAALIPSTRNTKPSRS